MRHLQSLVQQFTQNCIDTCIHLPVFEAMFGIVIEQEGRRVYAGGSHETRQGTSSSISFIWMGTRQANLMAPLFEMDPSDKETCSSVPRSTKSFSNPQEYAKSKSTKFQALVSTKHSNKGESCPQANLICPVMVKSDFCSLARGLGSWGVDVYEFLYPSVFEANAF